MTYSLDMPANVTTLRVFVLPTLQCSQCGSVMMYLPCKLQETTTHCMVSCNGCDLDVIFPLSFIDCEIAPPLVKV